MKIKNEFPPNYELIKLTLNPKEEYVYCYGDTIYNPSGKEIPSEIIFHESIHSKQQGDNKDTWWSEYLTNKKFRLQQEIEAYGEQYLFIKRNISNNKFQKQMLQSMAEALSGEGYGNLVNYNQAETLIRKYEK